MKKIFFLLLISNSILSTYAQMVPARFQEARELYKRLAYSEAIPLLIEECISNRNKFLDADIMLADCYRQTNQYKLAEGEYAIVSQDKRLKDQKQKLFYAQILQTNQKYELAAFWYSKFLESFPDDRRAKNQLEACNNIQQFQTDKKFRIFNMPFNTDGYDFGACVNNNVLYFTSTGGKSDDLKKKEINLWTGERYMDLYTSNIIVNDSTSDEFSKPVTLSKNINTKYNEGPLCFNKTNTKVYFTRNHYNPEDKKMMTYSKDKEANLNIYEATIENGVWKNIKELPFDSKEYSCGHPVWSEEESTLYFSSTMPGGFGGSDLWKAKLIGDKWEKPVNLGASVNTEGEEMFPTFDSDKNFYFASDGHGGLGGLDLFTSKITDNTVTEIKNLGTPVNSSYDDFAFLINEEKTVGFFSSDRPSGKGADDIYRFTDIKYDLEILVVDKFTNAPVDASHLIVKLGEELIADMISNSNGISKIEVDPAETYSISAEASGYLPNTIDKEIEDNEKRPHQKVTVEIQPLIMQVTVLNEETKNPVEGASITNISDCNKSTLNNFTDAYGVVNYKVLDNCKYSLLATAKSYLPKPATMVTTTLKDTTFVNIELIQVSDKPIVLNNIYYDFNKWDIRPEAEEDLNMLIQFIEINPDAILELSSHTDARGEDDYNLILSQKRAQSAVNWLVMHGVNENNIKPVGYGETKPVNFCVNNVKCSEEDHQRNRRTEFRVLNAGQVVASQVKKEIKVNPCKNCPF